MQKFNFLFETCDKTEIQFIQLCEDKFCLGLLGGLWHQF